MPLSFHSRVAVTHDKPASIRFTVDNVEMLNRALKDHPILNRIINDAITDYLTRNGYARKKQKAA